MSTTSTQKPLPRQRLPRRRKPPPRYGPPKALALFLILFVVIGGIVYGVWYMTRETPKATTTGPQSQTLAEPVKGR